MVRHDSEQRPTDIGNPYNDFESEAELELALVRAAARHPSKPRIPTTQPPGDAEPSIILDDDREAASNNVVRIPLHRLMDGDVSPPI